MKEIVINQCYGGFSLSVEAMEYCAKLKNFKLTPCVGNDKDTFYIEGFSEDNKYYSPYYFNNKRDDPDLIKTVKDLKNKANGKYSALAIIEIPDNVEYTIEEYDGIEWVAEKHRIWE